MDSPGPQQPVEPDPDTLEVPVETDGAPAQVDTLASRRRGFNRVRGVAAVCLVILFGLSFHSAGMGIWLHRSTLNPDVWAERVVPLGSDPAVQEALAVWTTNELMATVDTRALLADALPERAQVLAIPLSSAVEGFVRDRVDRFFASDRFEEVWATAAVKAHEQAVRLVRDEASAITAERDGVVINFVPLINAVLADILDAAPSLVGSDAKLPDLTVDDIPTVARELLATALGVALEDGFGTVTIEGEGYLKQAQTAVGLFDRLVVVTALVAVVTGVLALVLSTRRRRTVMQMLAVVAIGLVLVRRSVFRLQGEITNVVKVPVNQPAAESIVAAFVDPLTQAAEILLWGVGLLALVAFVTGPYPLAQRLRSGATGAATGVGTTVVVRAQAEETTAWVGSHIDALRIAGYAMATVALWFVNLSWISLALIALLLVGWQLMVSRLAPPVDEEPPPPLASSPAA